MSTIVEEKWEEILEFLRTEYDVSPVSYRMWLQPLKVYSVDDSKDEIVFSVDDQIVGQLGVKHIETKYVPFLSTAIAEFTNKFYNLKFMLSSQINEETEESTALPPKGKRADPDFPYPSLNPKYTFDTFVPGPNNKFALAASLAVAEAPAETYNPLFIYGGAGLGKTHLMNSIARYIIDHNPDARVIFTTSEIHPHRGKNQCNSDRIPQKIPQCRCSADRRYPVYHREGEYTGRVFPHLQHAV